MQCNPVHELTVKEKIFYLTKIFSSIDRYSKKKSRGSFLKKEAEFITDMDQLSDIFCSDEKRRELEKLNQLRMTSKDFDFYADQKGPRLINGVHGNS